MGQILLALNLVSIILKMFFYVLIQLINFNKIKSFEILKMKLK